MSSQAAPTGLRKMLSRGDHLVWLTGSALGMCLVMILGMLLVILTNGLGIFWPASLEQVKLKDGSLLAGELTQRQVIPDPDQPTHPEKHRLQFKVGNRDLYGADFRWVDEDQIVERTRPRELYLVERSEYGPLIGTPVRVLDGDKEMASGAGAAAMLDGLVARAARDRRTIKAIEKDEIGGVNYTLERIRLDRRKLDYRQKRDPARDMAPERQALDERETRQKAAYAEAEQKLVKQMESVGSSRVVWKTVDGQEKELRALDIYRAYPANDLGWGGRAAVYASRFWAFLTEEPREANTEGGIFPAIFGTVMMVFLMSLAVVPLGVLAALYLREYAKQGALVRTVRIAVNNLAGVPSIVFGVFGLGFFVYFVGGTIDRVFYPEA
ncbi:MAG: phosphate ABC transporter, permease protein PstA, partial [Burkholderiales bacterium]